MVLSHSICWDFFPTLSFHPFLSEAFRGLELKQVKFLASHISWKYFLSPLNHVPCVDLLLALDFFHNLITNLPPVGQTSVLPPSGGVVFKQGSDTDTRIYDWFQTFYSTLNPTCILNIYWTSSCDIKGWISFICWALTAKFAYIWLLNNPPPKNNN